MRFLTQILAIWCIAFAMLGSAFAADRTLELRRDVAVTATAIPVVEISDTAIQQIAHQLTRANLQSKTLFSAPSLQDGVRAQFARYGSQAEQVVVPKGRSLFDLGTALRL